ncbi:MAG: endonuclease/exonuclease/phosphatase family protein [Planctomycetes bacterium]|nr:endonuclease/exonuclease/phosphatase family protein [Planctomycetota bacterium]
MKRFCVCVLAVFGLWSCAGLDRGGSDHVVIAFWNVENLFDADDDVANPGDDEYLPSNGWTVERYHTKLDRLAEVIDAVRPNALGLAEVENRRVLDDLFAHPKLAPLGYSVVHLDSRDKRGIDVALAFREPFALVPGSVHLHEVVKKAEPPTRGVLEARLVLPDGETLTVLVNHWPSRGGDRDGAFRRIAGTVARGVVDSVGHDTNVVVMGDLNDDPFDGSVREALGALRSRNAVVHRKDHRGLFNPSWSLLGRVDEGSLYYNRDWVWNVFDQIIVSRGLVDGDGMQFVDGSFAAYGPDRLRDEYRRPLRFRRGRGEEWSEGYSDHFLVFAELTRGR